MKIKRYIFILFFYTFVCSINVLAASKNFVFNQNDPHHTLYVPDGDGPFPAILLLHASAGVEKVDYEWADTLKHQGYVVYIVDSFNPREYKDRKVIGWDRATAAQISDIAPAYHYLATLSFVKANHIGILGFSMGGYDVLRAMQIGGPGVLSDLRKLPFKAAVSFYGVCKRLPPQAKFRGPLKIFVGTKDDRATMAACEALVEQASLEGKSIFIKTYINAQHGFDNSAFPPIKELVDEKGEKYHVGYDKKSHHAAIQDLIWFFNKYLKS